MKKKDKMKVVRWTARILGLGVILFGLPFYFGYGNPLPFIDSSYTVFDNLWLTIFPLMFLGLGLGWMWEKVGGYLVTVSVIIGLSFTLVSEKEFIWFMLVPLFVGILYLYLGYERR